MNQYSEVLKYIKDIAERDPFINTITQGDLSDAFLNKRDIYPLLHIDINTGSFIGGQVIVFNTSLTCVQQRDLNKEIVNEKFYDNDNEVDNHNETLAVLNRIWTILFRDLYKRNITATDNPTLEKITDEKADRLDGWQINFDIEIPNDTLNICEGEI